MYRNNQIWQLCTSYNSRSCQKWQLSGMCIVAKNTSITYLEKELLCLELLDDYRLFITIEVAIAALPIVVSGYIISGGSRMGYLGQMPSPPPPPPPPPFKKLHTRSRYSNRAVNYSNKAVTMFMRQCSLPMKL